MKKKRKSPAAGLTSVVMLFYFLSFLLLALRNGQTLGFILAVAVPAAVLLGTGLLPRLFPADPLLLSLTNFLCSLGILLLYACNPAYALQQAVSYGVGLAAMIFCIWLVRCAHSWQTAIPVLMFLSLLLLALPILFGRETNGALNWLSVGVFSFQPSEAVKIILVISLAWFMSRRRLLPWLIFAAVCLVLLMLQRDLGTALMYYVTALLMFWAASGSWLSLLLGLAGAGGAAVWGYHLFAHVRRRVAIWLNPWNDYRQSGYQLMQGLVAIANGGLFGVGLGLGSPTSIPVYESDFIFAVLCEQFGLVFGSLVLLMYVALIWRGTIIAMEARKCFHGLMAMGAVILLGFQTFVIIGGVLKLIPLTGITLPFISYGGTSLVSSMCLIGLIQGVESINKQDLEEDQHLAMLDRRKAS